jgi:hypothetical protein
MTNPVDSSGQLLAPGDRVTLARGRYAGRDKGIVLSIGPQTGDSRPTWPLMVARDGGAKVVWLSTSVVKC